MTDLAVQQCPACRAPVDGGAFCESCGSRVSAAREAVVERSLPKSVHAGRALLFALLVLPLNALTNILVGILDPLILNAPSGQDAFVAVASTAELWVVVVTRLLIAVSLILTFFNAAAALAETKSGALSGRGRAKAAIVIGALLGVGWAVGVVLFLVQVVTGFLQGYGAGTP